MKLFTFLSICVAALVPAGVVLGQSDDYTLSLSSSSIAVGETITVEFESTAADISGDWIGLYKEGASDRSYVTWKYVRANSGSLTFTINQTGTFEFRYFVNNRYDQAAVSDPFTVTEESDDGDGGDDGGDNGDNGDDTNPDYTLSLSSSSIAVGETITVEFESTAADISGDWIGLYKEGASDRSYVTWKYVRANSGSLTFTINQTGTFEFRYFVNNRYDQAAVSDPFTVTEESDDGDGGDDGGDNGDNGDDTNPDYTLSLSSSSIAVGETITVEFESTAADISGDWIGLYKEGASDRSYVTWKYVRANSGSLTFTINQTGTFEFRYFVNNRYDQAAVSDPFTVTEESDDGDGGDDGGDNGDNGDDTNPDYTLSLSSSSIAVGETITVEFESTAADISGDWIGLYKEGASDRSYVTWKYVRANSGSLTFTINQTGTFEFRYFVNNRYDQAAVSDPFTVTEESDDGDGGDDGGDNGDNGDDTNPDYTLSLSSSSIAVGETITVEFESTAADISGDWIGLYKEGASDRSYVTWKYVRANSGSLTFTINQTGTFEFRYFVNNRYDQAAVSDPFTVTEESDDGDGGDDGGGDYSLTADKTTYQRNEIARVTWDVPSGESYYLNWIGLYEPGADDTEYLHYEYVDFLSRTETFPLDNDGLFEFRFFTNNSYNQVAVSDRIVVLNDMNASCDLDTSNITNYAPPTGPIIAFGDSLTAGVGATEGEDYVSELEDRLDVNIINEGVSGDTTRDALTRLESDVLSRDPAAVIVFLGGNDEIRRFYEQLSDSLADRNLKDELDELAARIGYDWENKPVIPREETFVNLESIITQIQATGAVTILVGFDTAIYDSNIADDYQAIADTTGSFYVPDIFAGIFGRSRFMSDLVHPNDAGYDFFADRIQPATACVLPDKQVSR